MAKPSPALKYWSKPTSPAAPGLLVNQAEAARLLGISERTVFALVDRRQLPARYIGTRKLFHMRDLEVYAAALPFDPQHAEGKEESR